MPKRAQYSQTALENAVKDVRNGLSKKAAAKKYGVPRATIQFRLSDKFVKASCGPPPILTNEEENLMEQWIIECARKGFPRRRDDIILSVQEFLNKSGRKTPFKDNLPGKSWYKNFLSRRPNITLRESESVTRASSCLSEDNIRGWFRDIENYLKEESLFDILKDPNRVYNGDETNFLLCPKTNKVLAVKGTKNVYEIEQGKAKEAVTCMFTFSASGKTVHPMIIYPYVRVPAEVVQSVPESWGIGRSESGWMKSEVFYEYVANVLNPFLVDNNVPKPVLLFVDGHKSHLSYCLSKLCNELGIVLIALYPNSTRILQPADVAAFKPIKNGWKKGILHWRREHINDAITKNCVAPILKHVVDAIKPDNLMNGFKACGLFPWNPNQIDFSKCLGKNQRESSNGPRPNSTLTLEDFEEICGGELVDKFRKIESVVLRENRPPEFYTLYKLWESFATSSSTEEKMLLNKDVTSFENTMLHPAPSEDAKRTSTKRPLVTAPNEDDDNSLKLFMTKPGTSMQVIGSNKSGYDSGRPNPKRRLDFEHDHTYHSPSKTKLEDLTKNKPDHKDIDESNNDINIRPNSSGSSLADVLLWPQTPKRKGKKFTEKVPFVVSSKKWRDIYEEKEKKKKLLEKDKEQRKLKREEKKNLEESKKQKAVSKINLKNVRKINIEKKQFRPTKSEKNPKDFARPMSQKNESKNSNVSKLEYDYVNNSAGLCYMCGGNFNSQENGKTKIDCDLCDKTFHKQCVDDINFDETTPIYVCKQCVDFSNDIVNSL